MIIQSFGDSFPQCDMAASDPRKLWKIVDDMLCRGRTPASSAIDLEAFNQLFVEKVAKVCLLTITAANV